MALDDEQEQLRSVALQNAQSILAARQRAEEELIRTRDALERKSAELASSLSIVKATLEASPDGILVVDEAGRIAGFNQKWTELWQLPEAKVRAKTYDQLLQMVDDKLVDPATFVAEARRITSSSSAESFDAFSLRDGRAFERISKVQLVDGKRAGRVWIFRDVTERKHAEEGRAQLLAAEQAARKQLERTSLMKDEFLATLSHELRTPLNAILGWSAILLSRADTEDARRGLEAIARNARAQARLIEDLLDMSGIISGKTRLDVQRTDLVSVIASAVDSIRLSAEAKAIRLQVVLDPDAGEVMGDPSRLLQVAWNVLSNAVKFTPQRGSVTVRLDRRGDECQLVVRDTGPGISPHFLPYIFERFQQADSSITRKHGGLGLGLAIVKQLVELHGGSVRAENGPDGHGASFTVCIPCQLAVKSSRATPAAIAPTALPTPRDADLSGLSVLVVDDDDDTRELIAHVLENKRAKVVSGASAREGLALLQAERPDVIVSDIGMPAQDGYEFIRRVRALSRAQGGETPAIALTAFARPEDRARALRAGFQLHIAKPVEPAELVGSVASLAAAPAPLG